MSLANRVLFEIRMCEEKEIFWHGTTSRAAKKIMKKGFLPGGRREQVWGEDTQGLASYPGNYFSQNIMTSIGAAAEAVRQFGGYETLIEVQIETRTSFPDEDVIPEMSFILPRAFQKHTKYLLNQWGAKQLLKAVEEGDGNSEEVYDGVIEEAIEEWVREITFNVEKVQGNFDVLSRYPNLRQLLRGWAAVTFEAIAEGGDRFMNSNRDEPEGYRGFEKKILDMMKGLPSRVVKRPFSRHVRIAEPFGFRGANRIVAIVVLPFQVGTEIEGIRDLVPVEDRYGWMVIYGNPSEDMKSQYAERMTDKFEIRRGSLEDIDSLYDNYGVERRVEK